MGTIKTHQTVVAQADWSLHLDHMSEDIFSDIVAHDSL